MRLSLIIFFLISCVGTFAQSPYDSTKNRQTQSAYGYDVGNYSFKTVVLPRDTVKMAVKDSGAIAFKGGFVWKYSGYMWNKVGSIDDAYVSGSMQNDSTLRLVKGDGSYDEFLIPGSGGGSGGTVTTGYGINGDGSGGSPLVADSTEIVSHDRFYNVLADYLNVTAAVSSNVFYGRTASGSGVASFINLSGLDSSNNSRWHTVGYYDGRYAPIGSAVNSIAAIGSTPNANGMTFTGGVLNLEPADNTYGGVLTAGAQTIGGNKTFSGQTQFNGNISTGTGPYSLNLSGISSITTRSGHQIFGPTNINNNTILNVIGNLLNTSNANIRGVRIFGGITLGYIAGGTQQIEGLRIDPVFNTTGGTTTYYGINLEPTVTSTTGLTFYGFRNTRGHNILNTSGESTLVGGSTPTSSAKFEVQSITQGSLAAPRMTKSERNAISSPVAGLLVIVTGETGGEYLSLYNANQTRWEKVNTTAD